MTQQVSTTVESNFTAGLKTDLTGLNFPENACIDTDNCIFSVVGDVTRRLGFDYETNFSTLVYDRSDKAISTYKWNDVAGDGSNKILVVQIGHLLHFYQSSAATIAAPLSTQKLVSTIDLTTFTPTSGLAPDQIECQYSDGDGYLFVFHTKLNPFYCTYSSGTVTATQINIKIRDFTGVTEVGVPDDYRPGSLTDAHKYNLSNQGWTQGAAWTSTSSSTNTVSLGSHTFTIASGLTIPNGQTVLVNSPFAGIGNLMGGTVTSYSGSTLVLNIININTGHSGESFSSSILVPVNTGYINDWFSAVGNYPSNSDVWWSFKDTSNDFSPATTQAQVTLGSGPAPKGFYILDAFNQDRNLVSGLNSITTVSTTIRPKVGAWYQGRVWYAGTDAAMFNETIYFSQIVEGISVTQFGKCYQINDPTSETLFGILPSDGGTIKIQGCGSVYKLFSIQNGLLVFAANGIWIVTGSQGLGFAANDYAISKISSIRTISSDSFVNVQGLPVFWNEEGIYAVSPNKDNSPYGLGGLTVESLTVGTISDFYEQIPLSSKRYAKGDYDPIDYVIRWIYSDTEKLTPEGRYSYNNILNFNTYNKAFYPWTIPGTSVSSIDYVMGPGGSDTPASQFKYLASTFDGHTYHITFAEEKDTNYVDWTSADEEDYESFFITGYKLHGNAQRKFQPNYVYVFQRNNTGEEAYQIQGIWNFATSGDTGKYSSVQLSNIVGDVENYSTTVRRFKIRGHGISLQFKISSVTGKPFDIVGWSVRETQNTNV